MTGMGSGGRKAHVRRQLITICVLVGAVVTIGMIGLAITGILEIKAPLVPVAHVIAR
jgi:hypothetical protein